jgi:hypothetical protein
MTELFPDEDYRFNFRFERGSFAGFFAPASGRDQILAERKRWLQSDPRTYAALLPAGIPLLEETIELGLAEQVLPGEFSSQPSNILALGSAWEPDFLFLKPDSAGQIILVGGCVCFPSSWSLAEKIGHPIETIHGVVPGRNPAIGNQIHGFLAKLRPGTAWLRANWGLTRSPELNQHPDRKLARLDSAVRLEETWLRIERQMLAALPKNRGVLFAIRIAMHPLIEIKRDVEIARGLRRALETMPEEMARYKGIATARTILISLLRDA